MTIVGWLLGCMYCTSIVMDDPIATWVSAIFTIILAILDISKKNLEIQEKNSKH